ncbi:MAG: hypothetical protein J7463_16605 [Roseiflexus sp.]|jgi:hypothetical protein|nr:hypothetical protein [Roseiflexus sp.]MBO9339789.1 hypothetical protein [Chloroflexus sp.]MBO9364367.1 hypothetical protein [Roseiflexus sp.]
MSIIFRQLRQFYAAWPHAVQVPSLQAWLWFIVGFGIGILLYVPFGSIQYDLNGLAEAVAVERGGPDIYRPNHMLYGVIGRAAFVAIQSFGYTGASVPILKIITALASSAAVGFSALAFRRLSGNAVVTLLASVLLAVSWSQWVFSTDVQYITLSLAFAAGALAVMVYSTHLFGVIAAGLLCTLAVLTWQASVFLLPGFALGQLILNVDRPFRIRLVAACCFIITCILSLSLTYLAVAILVHRYGNLSDIFQWLTSYGGARLPIWGRWSFDRLSPAGLSAIASIVPIWSGLGLRDLLRGSFRLEKLPALLSLLGLLGLILLSLWRVLHWDKDSTTRHRSALWLLLSYLVFLPFIVWWDPFEPKWFVIPNLFLVSVVAVIWGSGARQGKSTYAALGICVILIGFGNFQTTVWPRAVIPNPNIQKAACVSDKMHPADLFLETDWSWAPYVRYFYGRDTISLIDLSARTEDTNALLRVIETLILERHQLGGRVFIEDLDAYPSSQQEWLVALTGLSPAAFDSFAQQPSFRCAGQTIERLVLKGTK